LLLPEYSEQVKIGDYLYLLNQKIDLNNKINAELEAMAKLIYDYWFVQFDFPDANDNPYKSSGGRMVYNEVLKYEIPEGWKVEPVGVHLNIYDSSRIPMSRKERDEKQGSYPYFGATGVMDYVNDYIYEGDYILVAEDGSIMDENGMPIVQFIWGKTWVNNHAHVMQAKNKSQNEFYFQTLKRIPVVLIKTGSIQLKINQANLMSYKLLVPNDDLVNKYSILFGKVREKLKSGSEETKKLIELRDWLLPMLMNGQVTVKDV
jgi:type I restriction enzyme S subunit